MMVRKLSKLIESKALPDVSLSQQSHRPIFPRNPGLSCVDPPLNGHHLHIHFPGLADRGNIIWALDFHLRISLTNGKAIIMTIV